MAPLLRAIALMGVLAAFCRAQVCPPAIQIDDKPQVFVLSDISNEPDDTMSFIRLLLHSDQYNITGMAAVTSYWLNSSTYPDQILNTTHAFGSVHDNLKLHSAGQFPTSEYLSSIVKSGQPVYGTAALGMTPLSSGAQRMIDVVDGMADGEILHVQCWGGINVLGEVLFNVRASRTEYDMNRFIQKLRIYSISDQDGAGVWIRLNFPSIPFIVSIHAWNQYGLSTWSGISGDKQYISQHFQIGPLGSHYPDIAYIMEGDSPSMLHTMQNGLNGGPFDHPEWGGWGGRYNLLDLTRQSMVYTDAQDTVVGINNQTFTSNQATIWRWRQAYQDEMSARIQWSILGNYSAGSHPPVVSVNGSCGSAPLTVSVQPGQEIALDASGTYDPDANLTGKNALQYSWVHYREPTATQSNIAAEVPRLNFTLSDNGRSAKTTLPIAELACMAPVALHAPAGVQEVCQQYHVILEVVGSGTPPVRRYKRVILQVQPPVTQGASNGSKRGEL